MLTPVLLTPDPMVLNPQARTVWPIPVDVVDIAQSEALVERYGTRIPVLRRNDTGAELDWPFTRDQLLTFLQ